MSVKSHTALIWGINLNAIDNQLPEDFDEAMQCSSLKIIFDSDEKWVYLGIPLSILAEDDLARAVPIAVDFSTLDIEFQKAIKRNCGLNMWVKDILLHQERQLHHLIYYN